MPHTIAVAGKGGVGKTTTCGMLIDYLCKKKNGPVLVVDADANSNLNEVLGVEVETSLGAIREEMANAELKGTIPKGMTKADYAEMKFNSALIEVCIGVSVHHKDRALLLIAKVIDDHAAGGGFAHAALAGYCNGKGCCHKNPPDFKVIGNSE